MLKPIRVLVVGPKHTATNSRGGMATVVSLMREYDDPRVRIRTVATYVDDSVATRLWAGVRGMVLSSVLIVTRRVDVVHIHLAAKGSVVRKAAPLLAARLSGVPAVVHAHSHDFMGWFDGLPHWVQALVRRALAADRWLVLGDAQREQYGQRLHLPPDRLLVLRNPVRLPAPPAGSPAPPAGSPARPAGSPAQSADGPTVQALCLGRLGQRKGSYDLVEAMALLPAPVRAQLRVIAAGDGDVEQVRTAVERLGVGDVLSIRSWVDPPERDRLLAASDIFVLPSYDEGLPMALLEAMGWGLVPVVTPVGAIGEVLSDGVDSVLVPPGDPGALAGALTALVQDPQRRHLMAVRARERVAEFDADRWFDTLVTEWTRLAGRSPA